MKIEFNIRAPEISLKIKESLETLLDEVENYLLIVQLNYRDNNTNFQLNELDIINFDEYWIELTYKTGSKMFLNYENILEYSIVNNKKNQKRESVDYA